MAVQGINDSEVTAWLSERVSLQAPLTFDVITGGHSNLTFMVTDAGGKRWVLRRPPLNSVLATAHDMGREHRVVSALANSGVPVPPIVGLCTDEAVNGAPFYVMDFVEGTVVRNVDVAQTIDPSVRKACGPYLVKVLANLHQLNPDDFGLGDLGKKADYIARQLRRWMRQVDAASTRDMSLVRKVHDELAAKIPEQKDAGLVHGDYRLDNCIIDVRGDIAAVLDWELCTLGDVRADVGTLFVYWAEPGDDFFPLSAPPTSVSGFSSRQELVNAYCEASGGDFPELDYFVAFAFWRLACILEGVYTRYAAAAMGSRVPDNLSEFPASVDQLTRKAADIVGGKSAFAV